MRLPVFIPSRRSLKVGFGLLAVFIILTVGYYLLPWSVRKVVYMRAPSLDNALRKSGFSILQGWDELTLFGRDAEVRMDGSFRGDFAYGGLPSQGMKVFGRVNILENRGYVVGYSESMRNPLWVTYRIFDVPKLSRLEVGPRESRFDVDPRTKAQVSHNDYTRSGYDRGHMAPNYGIATRYGREAQLETFLMSNVIPQNPSVNRHTWKDLEMRVAKRYGRYCGEVWVLTGPIFQGEIKKLDSGIPVPSAYYKIIVDEHKGNLRALAFVVPRFVPSYTRMKSFLVSIDDVELFTDLDFFPDLPDPVEAELESECATRLWPWIGPAIRYQLFGRSD